MPSFYIASGLGGAIRAREIAQALVRRGFVWTYDWTAHGSVQHDMDGLGPKTAEAEMNGVACADFVVVLLPGGRGTHAELGAALALGKPALIFGEHFVVDGVECVFYRHPRAVKYAFASNMLGEEIADVIATEVANLRATGGV